MITPYAGEPINAFFQRAKDENGWAQCAHIWAGKSNEESFSLDVEILAPGEWSGSVVGKVIITPKHLEDAVSAFRALGGVLDVALKFGHNKEQKMTDGQPAIGWVSDVWVKSGKIMARFTDMPKIVYEAIKAKRYKNVSVEGLFDVEHKGEKYGFVLTAVALLGADIPAVNTLADLQTYLIAKNDLQFSNAVNFTAIGGSNKHKGESTMTPEEEAALRVELAAAKASNITLTADNTVAVAAQKKAEGEKEASEKTAVFTAQKISLTAEGDKLVKEGKATPAQRDEALKDLTADGVATAEATFKVLALSKGGKVMNTDETGGADDKDKKNEGKMPDDILHAKTMAFAAKHKQSYEVASNAVMAENPELAREYVDMTGTNE